MKDFLKNPPLIVHKAKGAYLYTDQGEIIDGISSWWCKSLGHAHPKIIHALRQQLNKFEHVITANTTFESLAQLGQELSEISNNQHVLFASDGASAVEIAMKLTLHAKKIQGQPQRHEFIALNNGYHGETLGALSLSSVNLYKEPYNNIGCKCHIINIPYVNGYNAPLQDNTKDLWTIILKQLEPIKEQCCAMIFEPLIQGAGGMQFYSAELLTKLGQWAQNNNIYLIADEIMTGIGRTGKWLASQYTELQPELICISKGLTAGCLPMSCVMIAEQLFEVFYNDYETGASFLHSHTYSGNALAVSAALATLDVIKTENLLKNTIDIGKNMYDHFMEIAKITNKLINVRSLGAIVAADFINWSGKRLGYNFQQLALKNGALLRPIGNTLYWLPPLNSDKLMLDKLAEITLKSINTLYKLTT